MEPENESKISVAPASTNQVLTSWLLATSPLRSASSSRFCVGSSDRSVSSCSSAIDYRASRIRSELVQHAPHVAEEARHHCADDDQQDQETNHDRERHGDEIDLHLR